MRVHTFRMFAASGLSAALLLPIAAFADTLSIQSLSPGTNVPVGTALTFSVSGAGSGSTFTVSDTYSGSSLDNTAINSSGSFRWTPLIQDIGAHTLTIYTSSATSTGSVTQAVAVVPKYRVSLAALSPGSTLNPGQTLTFTATTTGFSNPTFSLTDDFLGGTLSLSALNTLSGIFSWTPTTRDVGVHTVTVTASDSSNNRDVTTRITVAGTSTALTTTAPLPGSTNTSVLTTTAPLPGTPYVPPAAAPTVTAPVLAPAAPSYVFTLSLKQGSTGDEVVALQNVLIAGGYLSGSATGYFGPATAAAVMKYQTAHGLSPLGIVGPATRDALNGGASIAAAPTIATSATDANKSARQRVIQLLLAQLDQMRALLVQLQSL